MKNYSLVFLSFLLAATAVIAGFTAAGSAHTAKAPENRITGTEPISLTAEVVSPIQLMPTASKPEFEDRELTLNRGETEYLALSAEEEKLLKSWSSSNEEVVAVDSGGRVDALSQGDAEVTAELSNGGGYIYKITVGSDASPVPPAKQTTAITANEDIAAKNKKNSSKMTYRIYVNRSQNVVTVYTYGEKGKYNVPVRAMICSCGIGGATITGEYSTYFRAEWHALYNGVYGQYVTGISGDYLFHSVPYEDLSMDSLELEEYNKLGSEASLGCVRLSAGDAQWIYENCENGTFVKIYDSDEPEPLGKPEPLKVTDMSCGWDPTDPDKSNPYSKQSPRITGAGDITVALNSEFDPLASVGALDTCGNDITDRLVCDGNVVTSRAGSYRLTYSVTDALSRRAEKTVIVSVE